MQKKKLVAGSDSRKVVTIRQSKKLDSCFAGGILGREIKKNRFTKAVFWAFQGIYFS